MGKVFSNVCSNGREFDINDVSQATNTFRISDSTLNPKNKKGKIMFSQMEIQQIENKWNINDIPQDSSSDNQSEEEKQQQNDLILQQPINRQPQILGASPSLKQDNLRYNRNVLEDSESLDDGGGADEADCEEQQLPEQIVTKAQSSASSKPKGPGSNSKQNLSKKRSGRTLQPKQGMNPSTQVVNETEVLNQEVKQQEQQIVRPIIKDRKKPKLEDKKKRNNIPRFHADMINDDGSDTSKDSDSLQKKKKSKTKKAQRARQDAQNQRLMYQFLLRNQQQIRDYLLQGNENYDESGDNDANGINAGQIDPFILKQLQDELQGEQDVSEHLSQLMYQPTLRQRINSNYSLSLKQRADSQQFNADRNGQNYQNNFNPDMNSSTGDANGSTFNYNDEIHSRIMRLKQRGQQDQLAHFGAMPLINDQSQQQSILDASESLINMPNDIDDLGEGDDLFSEDQQLELQEFQALLGVELFQQLLISQQIQKQQTQLIPSPKQSSNNMITQCVMCGGADTGCQLCSPQIQQQQLAQSILQPMINPQKGQIDDLFKQMEAELECEDEQEVGEQDQDADDDLEEGAVESDCDMNTPDGKQNNYLRLNSQMPYLPSESSYSMSRALGNLKFAKLKTYADQTNNKSKDNEGLSSHLVQLKHKMTERKKVFESLLMSQIKRKNSILLGGQDLESEAGLSSLFGGQSTINGLNQSTPFGAQIGNLQKFQRAMLKILIQNDASGMMDGLGADGAISPRQGRIPKQRKESIKKQKLKRRKSSWERPHQSLDMTGSTDKGHTYRKCWAESDIENCKQYQQPQKSKTFKISLQKANLQ